MTKAQLARRPWQRSELLVAFRVYCQTPFGRLHKSNPDIMKVAVALDRTPSSLAMKLVNFASLDPVHHNRGVQGLRNASKSDRMIWEEFHTNWEGLIKESQDAIAALLKHGLLEDEERGLDPNGQAETERVGVSSIRLVQRFFRKAVLTAYGLRCAICKLDIPQLLVASHIIPWSIDEMRRADPSNGLSLCALHDRAFDRGLITVDADFNILVSNSVPRATDSELERIALIEVAGAALHLPDRFAPDNDALTFHRDTIFVA